MAQRQTRRSISVKGSTDLRIRRFAEDNKLSSSGVVEGIITEKLGEATDREVSVYEAYEQERLTRLPAPVAPTPSEPQEVEPPNLPKTGLAETASATEPTKRPAFNQPKHKAPTVKVAGEGDGEESEEMEGYIPPHLLF